MRGRLAPRGAVRVLGAVVSLLVIGLALTGFDGDDTASQPAPAGPAVSAAAPTSSAPGSASVAGVGGQQAGSRTGAAAVAAGRVAAAQEWLYEPDERVRAEVLALSTPDRGPRLAEETVRDLAGARDALGRSSGAVWWIVHPIATRVVSFDAGAATVQVWAVTVLSTVDVAAPQSEWFTATVELVWDAGRWLVDDVVVRPGPTPAVGPHDRPVDAGTFAAALDGFVRLDGTALAAQVVAP